MQDRKNGGERMEAVLLGLTPEVRVSDRAEPPCGALRRELAAVTGLAVTALDLDPRTRVCLTPWRMRWRSVRCW